MWFNPFEVAAAYHAKPWSDAYWRALEPYFADLAAAGQKTILTTIVPYPWRVGWNDWKPQTAVGYASMVRWQYDGRHWHYGYAHFDAYVEHALRAGLGPKITAFSMLDFRGPLRITYEDTRTGTMVTRKIRGNGRFWEQAWGAFLTSFSRHLEQRGWLNRTWLAFDERPRAMVARVMELVRKNAPWFQGRMQMAGKADLNDVAEDLSLGLSSLHSVSHAWIDRRRRAGKTTTFYTWAGDTHPNTLSFSPAIESRLMGWVVASRHLDGYLHWAYDDWPKDVFTHPVYAYSQGDEYFVYPGQTGPLPSIRWELLKAGMQDAELVYLLRRQCPKTPHLENELDSVVAQSGHVRERAHALVRIHDHWLAQLSSAACSTDPEGIRRP